MLTSSSIKQKATSLGFDVCGIAEASDYPELAYLQEWLALGYAGEMAWMARTAERRGDVRHVVPGARSVIVMDALQHRSSVPRTSRRRTSRVSRGMRGARTITTC